MDHFRLSGNREADCGPRPRLLGGAPVPTNNTSSLSPSKLMVAVDFTQSNDRSGEHPFGGADLHTVISQFPSQIPSQIPSNPYQRALRTLIPAILPNGNVDIDCYGFGDETTLDRNVFSFFADQEPCRNLAEVLEQYEKLVPFIRKSGPTSYAPAIHHAIQKVASGRSSGSLHEPNILLIITDGPPTAHPHDTASEQEEATLNAISAASHYPLSIIVIGVGEGPWDGMLKFIHKLSGRLFFDNFLFINFSEVLMGSHPVAGGPWETAVANQAVTKLSTLFKEMREWGLLGGRPPPHRAFQGVETEVRVTVLGPPATAQVPEPPSAPPLPYHQPDYGSHLAPGCGSHMAPGHGLRHQPAYGSQTAPGFGLQPPPDCGPHTASGDGSQPRLAYGPRPPTGGTALPAPTTLTTPVASPSRMASLPKHYIKPSASAHCPPPCDPSRCPDQFICPILQEVMRDPVFAADGYTYERCAIERWLVRHDSSPMTNQQLPNKTLIPNHSLRSAMMEARQQGEI